MKETFEKYGVQLALIAVAAIWGATFTVVGNAIAKYPMYGFLFWRFALAAVVFCVLFPRTLKKLTWANIRFGVIAGVLLALGYIFQTWALDGEGATTAARCAFITGLYVVFVPFAQAIIMRKKPQKATIIGIGAAVVGLFILSGVLFENGAGWVSGDTLTVICALAYTAHMLLLGMRGRDHDTMAITLVQIVTSAVLCGVISFIKERPPFPTDPSVIWAIVICAVFASAIAHFVQNWAQKRVPPSRVALILVTEPAFGGVFGWFAAGAFPLYEVAGAALMLAGMIYSEAAAARRSSREVELEEAIEGIPVFEERDG